MARRLPLLAVLLLCGCVERIVAVRSDPPGAVAFLDGQKIGQTPCETSYTWYGKRELSVELQGYRAVRELVTLNPPWWQFFPLDFVTDVLLPFKVYDRVECAYVLQPSPATPEEVEEVRKRAAELREKAGAPK